MEQINIDIEEYNTSIEEAFSTFVNLKDFDTEKIEKFLNYINGFFNTTLIQEYKKTLSIEKDISKFILELAISSEENIKKLLYYNKTNNENLLDFENNSITLNKFIESFSINIDGFTFFEPVRFTVTVNETEIPVIPFDFEGTYIEEIESQEESIFRVNENDDITFYTKLMNKINFKKDIDYKISNNKITIMQSQYKSVIVEYDPVNSDFVYDVYKTVQNVTLAITNTENKEYYKQLKYSLALKSEVLKWIYQK